MAKFCSICNIRMPFLENFGNDKYPLCFNCQNINCPNCKETIKPDSELKCPKCGMALSNNNNQKHPAPPTKMSTLKNVKRALSIIALLILVVLLIYNSQANKLTKNLDMVYEAAFLIDYISNNYENKYNELLRLDKDFGFSERDAFINLQNNVADLKLNNGSTEGTKQSFSTKLTMINNYEEDIINNESYRLSKINSLLDSSSFVFSNRNNNTSNLIMAMQGINSEMVLSWVLNMQDVSRRLTSRSPDESSFRMKIEYLKSNNIIDLRDLRNRISHKITMF